MSLSESDSDSYSVPVDLSFSATRAVHERTVLTNTEALAVLTSDKRSIPVSVELGGKVCRRLFWCLRAQEAFVGIINQESGTVITVKPYSDEFRRHRLPPDAVERVKKLAEEWQSTAPPMEAPRYAPVFVTYVIRRPNRSRAMIKVTYRQQLRVRTLDEIQDIIDERATRLLGEQGRIVTHVRVQIGLENRALVYPIVGWWVGWSQYSTDVASSG